MPFIQFTHEDGGPISIRVESVIAVHARENGITFIDLGVVDDGYAVRGEYEDIMRGIRAMDAGVGRDGKDVADDVDSLHVYVSDLEVRINTLEERVKDEDDEDEDDERQDDEEAFDKRYGTED